MSVRQELSGFLRRAFRSGHQVPADPAQAAESVGAAPQPRDEHFSPVGPLEIEPYIQAGDFLAVHHLIRYLWARTCLLDVPSIPRLLDLGCGDGYGTFQLATALPNTKVVGSDYDELAVGRARDRYRVPNLSFRVGDGTRWRETIGDDVFDVIVCFDVLEHVVHREIFMEELVRHIAPNGVLLFSTPSGTDWNDFQPTWEYHQIEYSARSLFDFLSRYFSTLRRPDDGSLPHTEVFDKLKGGSVTYALKMNPLLCERPIQIKNPYPQALPPARASIGAGGRRHEER